MKLTDTQTILLSAAANRDDRLIAFPNKLTGAVAATIARKFIALRLAEEIPVDRNAPHWRKDADGKPVGLRVTEAGFAAIGIVEGEPDEEPAAQDETAASHVAEQASAKEQRMPRPGTKQSQLITLLSRPEGAGIVELMEATGWLPHTVRAALTRLRQRGYSLERHKDSDITQYRIVACLERCEDALPHDPIPTANLMPGA